MPTSSIDLSGRVALITGAGRGIGAATCERLAQAGVAVMLAGRKRSDVERNAAEIRHRGGAAAAVTCDVACWDDVQRSVAMCERRFGGLDILVSNAGLIEPIARLADSDPTAWARAADVNYKGVYHGLRAALPGMLARGGGTIINLSSGAATSALEGWSHYCSSKAAVLALTRCAHRECHSHGVRVFGFSPGTVATDMQLAIRASGINPVSQLDPSAHIPPAWAAEAIAWLCTEAADPYAGDDFSLKTEEGRRLVGLT